MSGSKKKEVGLNIVNLNPRPKGQSARNNSDELLERKPSRKRVKDRYSALYIPLLSAVSWFAALLGLIFFHYSQPPSSDIFTVLLNKPVPNGGWNTAYLQLVLVSLSVALLLSLTAMIICFVRYKKSGFISISASIITVISLLAFTFFSINFLPIF